MEQDRQLARLPCVVGAAFDSYHRQHEPQCIYGTRVDLLRQVEEWSVNHEKCIFWLNGMAGTGKSTIARTVARTFHDQGKLGASFFFSRGAGDLGHANSFVSTLAHQLADTSPLLKQYICQAAAKHPNIAQQGLRAQWKELILLPLARLDTQCPTLSLVIDALDECEHEEDVKLILQLFIETKDLNAMNVGIFVTSRPEIPIRLVFRDMPKILHQDLVLHDVPRPVIEHDISVFLRHELHQIGKKHNLQDWPDEEKIKLLVQRSDCLFIYITTVCRFVGDLNWLPEEQLSLILQGDLKSGRPTAKLDEMYIQVLQCSLTKDRCKEEKVELGKRFKHIVGSIVVLFDVLSVSALADLLSISVKMVDVSLNSLRSVLNINEKEESNGPIRLLHPSFRDFLLDKRRCQDSHFWVDQEKTHKDLVTSCLRLLSENLNRDVCNLKTPGTPARIMQKDKIYDHLPRHVQYACRYWIQHLERVSPHCRDKVGLHNGQIHHFFQINFLHWLEALGLMGKISEGVLMITKLELMFKVRYLT